MKYVSKPLLLILIGTITACTLQQERSVWDYDNDRSAALVATEQFLPVLERDENGRLLPYRPAPNPYTALEGRIDKDAVATYIEARRAFNAGQFDESEQLLVELVKEEPQLSGPLVMRGDIAMARENIASATEHYIAALKVNPINFNAYLRLAKAQRMQGQFIRAQNTYARALERWPDGAEIHLNLGVLYDLYLNQPLAAQAHMEAYQFFSGDNSGEVVAWLEEIRQRTGVDEALNVVRSREETDRDLAATQTPEELSED